jgi:hypothetical protein
MFINWGLPQYLQKKKKTKKTCVTPPRTSVPTIAQDNTALKYVFLELFCTPGTQVNFQPDLSHLPHKLQLDMSHDLKLNEMALQETTLLLQLFYS